MYDVLSRLPNLSYLGNDPQAANMLKFACKRPICTVNAQRVRSHRSESIKSPPWAPWGLGLCIVLTGAIAIAYQFDNDTEVPWPEKTKRLGVAGVVAF